MSGGDEVPEEPNEDEAEDSGFVDDDPLGGLSPRQRRLAQLLAEGLPPAEIKRQIGYSSSRISILQQNPLLRAEVLRLQDRIFEETVSARLKSMSDKALSHIDYVLSDRLGRVKMSEKSDVAKWLLEKVDGKAVQKVDAGENLLSLFLDRLDAQKSRSLPSPGSGSEVIDVTHSVGPGSRPPPAKDELEAWVDDFCSTPDRAAGPTKDGKS